MPLVCRPHVVAARTAAPLLAALALLAPLVVSSCGDSPTRPPVAVNVWPVAVTIVLGDSRQLSATVVNASDAGVVWWSGTPAVATVDAGGSVTAVGVGTATITAVSRADTTKRASVQVSVPALQLTLSPGPGTLLVGQTHRLSATLENALDATVTWRSSAPAVVDVDVAGLLRARGAGSATITAVARADSVTRSSLTVTVPAIQVSIAPAGPLSLLVGARQALAATVTNAMEGGVLWRSDAPAVSSVDAAGFVTALATGSATITALSAADTTARTAVTVSVPPVVVTASPSAATVLVGEARRLAATVAGAVDTTVTWRSDAPSVAIVGAASGMVTGVAPGQATVIAVARADTTRRATASVTVPAPSVAFTAGPSTLVVGQTYQLRATVVNALDTTVIWRSDAPAVVAVDSTGLIRGVTGGHATVFALARADTTVRAWVSLVVPPVGIAVSPPGPITLALGAGQLLTATVSAAMDRRVAWRSSAPAVVQVGDSGVVTGLAPGAATVTAIALADTTARATVSVAVSSVSVTVSPPSATLYAGSTQRFTASVAGASATGVSWSSSAPAIATVDGTGLVTAIAPGAATITATADADPNAVATAAVTVLALAHLTVNITGLPAGALAGVRVTGPGAYSRTVDATTTLTGLVAGTYTVTASDVVAGATTYTPAPASQTVSLAAGAAGAAAVVFTLKDAFNVSLDNFYVTQATQTWDRAVPLVAGRNGYLRVFATANKANTATPPVRVRLYSGATLVTTLTLAAPAAGVPQAANEGSLASSWNVPLAGSLIQPGLGVLVDIDPDATLDEDRADDVYPRSAAPMLMDVRSVQTFSARLVPIYHATSGLTGNASDANKDSFLTDVVRMYPVRDYDVDVRATFTTNAGALSETSSWLQVLQEIDALRVTDGSARYYYGVLPSSSGASWCGYGYVPGRAAIGTDNCGPLTSAHEWGHNFGRAHAPCGSVADPDPSYPYTGATLGTVWGMDVAAGKLVAPSTNYDIMGYCWPKWVSDYTYKGILAYRAAAGDATAADAADARSVALAPADATAVGSTPAAAAAAGAVAPASARPVPALLVWGRVEPGGRVVLEPALELDAPPALPAAPGPDAVEGLDAAGNVLFALSFTARTVADAPAGARHFAFVVPVTWAPGRLAALRLRAAGHPPVTRASAAPPTPEALVRLDASLRGRATAPNALRLTWDAAAFPMAMIRDPATGQVLAFARAGDATLRARPGDLDVTLSDGVRSVHRRITAR